MDDLAGAGPVNILIEASAEPSVHAGYASDPSYVVHTNLFGAANCLEYARRQGSDLVFLSTSRVYSIDALCALPLDSNDSRFLLRSGVDRAGVSGAGISESFSLSGHRSLYGTTKLAAELLIEEYRVMYRFFGDDASTLWARKHAAIIDETQYQTCQTKQRPRRESMLARDCQR